MEYTKLHWLHDMVWLNLPFYHAFKSMIIVIVLIDVWNVEKQRLNVKMGYMEMMTMPTRKRVGKVDLTSTH